MPPFASWLKTIALRGDRRRQAVAARYLVDVHQFDLAAEAERMRVDRNGSVVALLAIRLAAGKDSPADVARLARWMASRLRMTDTCGWLRDGRIGVLLPDTSEHGAWTVASDLCDLYAAGADRPDCEVLLYPPKHHRNPSMPSGPGAEADGSDSAVGLDGFVNAEALRDGSSSTATLAARPAVRPETAVREAFDEDAVCDEFERLFVRRMPAWKRAIDVAGASVGLMLAGPVILAAAAAIRVTSPGGAFFTQEREGLAGKRFRIFKLRTMRPDAESLKADLRSRSEQDGPAFKMRNDPRITPIGRLLRKTSIDELPQLLNVLRGEMSLVGPRPLPVDESRACEAWHRRRLHVTPGITCIWQIEGRNVVAFDEWVRMDLRYARKRSPWLDLKLVLKTGPSLVLPKGQ